MKVSIVVPDGIMVVDGVARQVSMDGLPVDLHAIQWEDGDGDAEYGKPNRRNEKFSKFETIQFMVDRWTAAAPPPPPPPPPPPTKDEQLARAFADPALDALLDVLAVEFKVTKDELKTKVKDKMP